MQRTRSSQRLPILAVVVALALGVSPDSGGIAWSGPMDDATAWLPSGQGPLPAALVRAIRVSPHAFFRMANRAWAGRVCAAFADDLPSLGPVRLHGDAHIEQYALTDTAYGLDDFDDTAEGPSVIDLVRFLGSLNLAARERGWSSHFDRLADEFLHGYQRGLKNPDADAKVPRVVLRLRARPARDQAAFLAWADGLMKPVTPPIARATHHALDLLAAQMRTGDSGRSADYFRVKRVGRIDVGLGSHRLPKLLIRVEGATSAARDDVILEAKEPANLSGVECLAPPKQSAAVRIIAGTEQIGRLRHDVLSLAPNLLGDRSSLHHWWIHDWTPSYVEVNIHDLRSVNELSELAHDAGFQLGSASLPVGNDAAVERRRREARTIEALEARIKRVSVMLTGDLLRAWDAFRRKSSAPAEGRQ